MSNAYIPDAERTAIMVDLVRRLHEPPHGQDRMPPGAVVLEEVGSTTGGGGRRADVLALGIWRSTGRRLRGYEIKASRADLKRELADPMKYRAVSRFCDRWSVVVWDESMLMDGLPDAWGIMVTRDGEHGRELHLQRKAEALTPEPWTRDFICSMIRNAYQQAPGAAYVARAVGSAIAEQRREDVRAMEREMRKLVLPLHNHFHGADAWRMPTEKIDPAALIARAVQELQQGMLFSATTAAPEPPVNREEGR